MFFSDIQISSYKSYRNSGKLDLSKGINIVVGRNNAGKTALLEALSLKFDANPHRAISSPSLSRTPRPESLVTFTFTITRDELIDLLIDAQSDGEFYLPLPELRSRLAQRLNLNNQWERAAQLFPEWFFSHDSYTFRIQREAFGPFPSENWYIDTDAYVHPQFERTWENDGALSHYGKFRVDPIERTFSFFGHMPGSGGRKSCQDFLVRISRLLNRYTYRFKAERIAYLPYHLGMDRMLAPDASNLAEVLSHLNHAQLERYRRLVQEVLPEICQVNSRRLDNNRGEVVIWNNESAALEDELAFNLNESGSGVGQVLATLYVVLTAREPQVIILDEPQSFLHPGAVRKLVEVLRQYTKDKHQLIIATHSPTVITSADPTTVTMIKQEEGQSLFESIDIKETAAQRVYLSEVGARLSDVFGYDRVLWVEGETEEICFPLILRTLTEEGLMGTAILRVQHTGDFNRKNADNVIRIYERLSHLEGGLVPQAVGFIFDQDNRAVNERADLERLSKGRIHFIGKRLFENYLLNPTAITAVLQSHEPQISEQQVLGWLEQNKIKAQYYDKRFGLAGGSELWTDHVNGVLLLEDMFKSLTDHRVFFDKIVHSPMLTEWLLENCPEELRELSNLLTNILTESASTN